MKMIVLEIQKVITKSTEIDVPDEEAVSVLTYPDLDEDDAEQKYHTILSYAAKSDISVHSAVMLDSNGTFMKSEGYQHPGNNNIVTENH